MLLSRRHMLLSAAGMGLSACSNGSPSSQPSSVQGLPTASVQKGLAGEAQRRALDALPPYAPHHLRQVRDKLATLVARRGPAQAGDWLRDHPEPGQSFEEYLKSQPTVPTGARRTLVVLPFGELSPEAKKVVELTAEYMTLHFGLPSRVAPAVTAPTPPEWAVRKKGADRQVLSGWMIESVLPPLLPADAAALIAFTTTDLWPGQGWNYVFGEASLSARVGVWSLHRYGDPKAGDAGFKQVLERTLKIAVHETGHMFSLPHCTAYPCIQSGVNSLEEADKSPLWLCPECLPKIAWATSSAPLERLSATRDFCRRHDLDAAAFLQQAIDKIA
jgi:archaemetzincin